MPNLKLTVQTNGCQEIVEFNQDEILIGRRSATNRDMPALILQDESISPKHARIWRSLVGYWIEDLSSKQGTKKKGVLLMGPERLFTGDFLELGGFLITVERADITEHDADLDELFNVHISDGFSVENDRNKSNPPV